VGNSKNMGLHVGTAFPVIGSMILVAIFGCGPASDRLAVSGMVKLNGVPLDSGSIRLTSEGSEKVVASGAVIQDGAFRIPADKGLPPGKYRVEMYAPDTKAPPVAYRGAPGEPQMPPTAPERIPPEYNVNSQNSVNVVTGQENHFEFDIVTKQAK
jgi:hypothetical protein